MGSLGAMAAGAAAIGGQAVNLINAKKQTKTNQRNMLSDFVQTTKKRKNLLDQQLASRRAGLGAAGVYSSSSALAAHNRDIDETYDSINADRDTLKRNSRQLNRNYRTKLYSSILNPASDAQIK